MAASMAEKVNVLMRMVTEAAPDPAERYAICAILLEAQRYHLNQLFQVENADQKKQQ